MSSDPTIEEQRAYYDDWNSRYRDTSFEAIEHESKARGERVLEIIRTLPLAAPRILEVGCGTGWLTEKLCDFGEVYAIDLSAAAIEIARRRGLPAQFVAADFMSHDFGDQRFDIVVCVETIFYVTDQPRFVKKLKDLTQDSGYLVLTSVNKFVYERRDDIPPPVRGQVRNWLGRRELAQLVAKHFRVIHVTTVLPKGNRGILRLVNSYKLNRLMEVLIPPPRIQRLKERLGLGHSIVMVAQRQTAGN